MSERSNQIPISPPVLIGGAFKGGCGYEREGKTDILLNEYNALREEVIFYQQSLRSIHLLIFTLLSVSLASFTIEKLAIIYVISPPIFLSTVAYGLNDLFHLDLLGRRIESIETKINMLAGSDLFAWETKIAKLIHGNFSNHRQLALFFIRPSILGDCIVAAFTAPLFIFAVLKGHKFVKTHFWPFADFYLIINITFFAVLVFYCVYLFFFGLKKIKDLIT